MMRAFVFLLVPFLSLAQEKTAARQILSILEQQVTAWNEGNIDGYMEGYWNSDETVFVSGGTMTKGYGNVLSRYKKHYTSRDSMGTLVFENIDVKVLAPNAAIVSGIWRLKRKADEPWGRFTLLFERKEEGWRIVYDHTSSAP